MELEAGKTYVYKSKADKKAYFESDSTNQGMHDMYYNEGFTIEGLVGKSFSGGYVKGEGVILTKEIKYFKLKKEETIQPTDMINVEMTALDALRLRVLLRYTSGGDSKALYLSFKHDYCLPAGLDLEDSPDKTDWRVGSELTRWALAQFEDPKQKEIDALKKTINEAKAKLADLKSGC